MYVQLLPVGGARADKLATSNLLHGLMGLSFHQGVLWAAIDSNGGKIIIIGIHKKTISCLAASLLDTQIYHCRYSTDVRRNKCQAPTHRPIHGLHHPMAYTVHCNLVKIPTFLFYFVTRTLSLTTLTMLYE